MGNAQLAVALSQDLKGQRRDSGYGSAVPHSTGHDVATIPLIDDQHQLGDPFVADTREPQVIRQVFAGEAVGSVEVVARLGVKIEYRPIARCVVPFVDEGGNLIGWRWSGRRRCNLVTGVAAQRSAAVPG